MRIWRKYSTWALLVGMQNGAATMENNMVLPQKTKNIFTIWSSNSISGYISKRIESSVSKRYLHTHVHSSVIYNSQKVEATQVSMNKWMDEQNVIYTYNVMLFSLNKGMKFWHILEPWGHRTQYLSKRQILHDSTYMRSSRAVKFIETESRMVVARDWGRGGWEVVKRVQSFNLNNVNIRNTVELYT